MRGTPGERSGEWPGDGAPTAGRQAEANGSIMTGGRPPMGIEVNRLGPQIGAEIRGVDVRRLDDAGFATIYRAWLDYNVVVVPGQDLTLDQFLAYSRRFGVVVPHPSKSTRHPEVPEITLLGVNKF